MVDSNLMMAEAYLLCDDPTSCRLELAEVENILGVNVCSRNKENFKKPTIKLAPNNIASKTTIEILLREWNDDDDVLGASPSLPRALYELPNWLTHSWDTCECICCNNNPLQLAVIVHKFFTYHGIASDIANGKV